MPFHGLILPGFRLRAQNCVWGSDALAPDTLSLLSPRLTLNEEYSQESLDGTTGGILISRGKSNEILG